MALGESRAALLIHQKGIQTMQLSEGRDILDRLYQRLADALQQARPEPFVAPVTVAEIYQELVPYRVVRDDVGFSMNADYEHALLRLLAGEGEWLQLEPATAREIIVRELKSPNPNVSIYREYAGCDVWVRPPADAASGRAPTADDVAGYDLSWLETLDEDEAPAPFAFAELVQDEEEEAAPTSQAAADTAPKQAEPVVAPPVREQPAAPQPVQREPARGGTAGVPDRGAAVRCAFCDSELPSKRPVRFCPWCGGDQSMQPCGSCGEALEAGWSFCVACGASAAGG
jgi:hypothetical protein